MRKRSLTLSLNKCGRGSRHPGVRAWVYEELNRRCSSDMWGELWHGTSCFNWSADMWHDTSCFNWSADMWHDTSCFNCSADMWHDTSCFNCSADMWHDTSCFNCSADGNYEVTLMTKATLYNNGRVHWEPPAIYKSSCTIDVEFYPFDEQLCTMKFGSWTYDGYQVDLKHIRQEASGVGEGDIIKKGIDLKDFYPSVEWDLLGVPARKNEKYYTCCSEPYPDITFNITIRRKTLFHTVNLIIPCVAITFLTVLVFLFTLGQRREDLSLHLHPSFTHRLLPPPCRDHSSDLTRRPLDRQVLALHHDPRHSLDHCNCHRLERALPFPSHAHHVTVGEEGLPWHPASSARHAATHRRQGTNPEGCRPILQWDGGFPRFVRGQRGGTEFDRWRCQRCRQCRGWRRVQREGVFKHPKVDIRHGNVPLLRHPGSCFYPDDVMHAITGARFIAEHLKDEDEGGNVRFLPYTLFARCPFAHVYLLN